MTTKTSFLRKLSAAALATVFAHDVWAEGVAYTGDFEKFSYSKIINWRGTSGSFHDGAVTELQADGTEGTVYNQTSDQSATSWRRFAVNQSAFSEPGLVLRFQGDYAKAVDATFAPFNLAGLIVETDGYSFNSPNNDGRSISIGDPSGTTETFCDIKESFTIKRGGSAGNKAEENRFFGTVTLAIAEGMVLDYNSAQPAQPLSLKGARSGATKTACLKMTGLGTLKVATLTATGAATLDYSAQSKDRTTPYIDGNLAVDEATIINFPAGVDEKSPYKLCSGTIAIAGLPVAQNKTILVGSETKENMSLVYSAADGTVYYTSETVTLDVARIGSNVYGSVAEAVNAAGADDVIEVLLNDSSAIALTKDVKLSVGEADSVALAGVISGTGTLTKVGAGTLTLNAENTYTGSTIAQEGVLISTKAKSFGNNGVERTLEVKEGANVTFNASSYDDSRLKLVIAGSGINNEGAVVLHGNGNENHIQFTGIELAGDATIFTDGTGGMLGPSHGATTIDVKGHTLTKAGTGTFTLITTTIQDTSTEKTGSVVIAAGTFSAPNKGTGNMIKVPVSGTGTWTTGSKPLTIDTGDREEMTISVAITGNQAITKNGDGTLNLTAEAAALTYTGTITLNAGTITAKKSDLNVTSGVSGQDVVKTTEDGVTTYTLGVPTPVVAKIGDEKYETLDAAIEAAQAGNTVTLLTDVTLTSTIELTKAITLDFAGHKISIESGAIIDFKTDDKNKTLSLEGKPDSYTPSFTLSYGKIKIASGKSITVKPGVNDKNVTGDVTDATIYGYTTYSVSYRASSTAIVDLQAAVDAAEADATVSYTEKVAGCLVVSNRTTNLTLDIGNYEHSALEDEGAAIVHKGTGTLTLTGSDSGQWSYQDEISEEGTFVNNGNVIKVSSGTVVINSGSFTAFAASAIDVAEGGRVQIKGGTFVNLAASYIDDLQIFSGTGNIVLEGGVFFPKPDEKYLKRGKKLVEATQSSVFGAWEVVDDPDVSTYPDYIGDDADKQAKYDAWAQTYGDDTTGESEDAFLLNCAPTEVADEIKAFKITAITVGETVEVVAPAKNTSGADYNGTVTIKGKATLDAENWADQAEGHRFFKAELK